MLVLIHYFVDYFNVAHNYVLAPCNRRWTNYLIIIIMMMI